MRDYKNRLMLSAVIAAVILFAVTEANPQMSKFLRDSYSSNRLLEHGIHAIFQAPNLSESCSRDLRRFGEQLGAIIGHPKGKNGTTIETWALQMLDAWAKIPEGILSGHVNALGDFDECLAVRAPSLANQRQIASSEFQGKYCLIYVMPNLTLPAAQGMQGSNHNKANQLQSGERSIENLMKILTIVGNAELPLVPSIGSCLPSTCTDDEILQITSILFSNLNLIPLTSFCSVDEPQKMSTGAIATISLLGVLVGLGLIGSVVDIAIQHHYLPFSFSKSKLTSAMLSFSIVSNGKKFLNCKVMQNDVSCLHGIRFLSASWVVLGHSYLMGVIQPLWNIVDTYTTVTTSLSLLVVVNAAIVVDVFFVVGGFLVSLTLLAMLEQSNGKMNILMLYVHRYLRITPMYMIIVCIGTFVFPLLGSGPYWHVAKTWAGFCEKNWWKNMLYINNLPIYDTLNDPSDAPCHGMAWYLGVDMQLFLLSPFLLFPIWKWKKYGSVPLTLLTLASVIIPGVITYVNNYLPTTIPFGSRENKYSQEAYTPTYMRATPYLIGMCTGLLFHSIRNKAFKLKKSVVIGAWMLAFSVGFTVLFSPQKFFQPGYEFKREESAVYVSGHRTAWALCISWLIFACGTGYGGWINQILSWRPFIPLGRLTFAIYLVSMHLQFLFHLQYRQPIYFSNYHMVNLYFGHLVMSCLIALGCTLLIEAPFMQLLKLMLPTRSKKRNSKHGAADETVNNNNAENDTIIRSEKRCSVSPDPSGTSQDGGAPSGYGSTNVLGQKVPNSARQVFWDISVALAGIPTSKTARWHSPCAALRQTDQYC